MENDIKYNISYNSQNLEKSSEEEIKIKSFNHRNSIEK